MPARAVQVNEDMPKKLKHTPAVRSKILSKLFFASCACDIPIARITGGVCTAVSSLRIYIGLRRTAVIACTRVTKGDVNQSVHGA